MGQKYDKGEEEGRQYTIVHDDVPMKTDYVIKASHQVFF